MVMSVVTVSILVLAFGFLATALVGFFGWRQRMREGVTPARIESRRGPGAAAAHGRETIQYGFEGARS
jgi:hypothetical protein